MSALHALLTGLVDYAGLFPPASRDMTSAVREYAGYRSGPHATFLGSFVVPAARLGEFERAVGALGTDAGERPWLLSVLAGDRADEDVQRALCFHPAAEQEPAIQIVAIETKAESASTVDRVAALAPGAPTLAFEIPLSLSRAERWSVLSAVKAAGRSAKVRTGGVTPESIPSPGQVAEFIWDCARAGVPFKATAGLHHPVRGEYPLTYAPDSQRALMHGFLNVFLASAAAWAAAQRDGTASSSEPPASVVELVEERDASSFRLDGAVIRWRGQPFSAWEIARTRGGLGRAFGSCSFVEPISELGTLGWLPAR
jgi:hypothetical protein